MTAAPLLNRARIRLLLTVGLMGSALIGFGSALGAGIGTMFLSWGNALTFGGLLATLPSEARFEEVKTQLKAVSL